MSRRTVYCIAVVSRFCPFRAVRVSSGEAPDTQSLRGAQPTTDMGHTIFQAPMNGHCRERNPPALGHLQLHADIATDVGLPPLSSYSAPFASKPMYVLERSTSSSSLPLLLGGRSCPGSSPPIITQLVLPTASWWPAPLPGGGPRRSRGVCGGETLPREAFGNSFSNTPPQAEVACSPRAAHRLEGRKEKPS